MPVLLIRGDWVAATSLIYYLVHLYQSENSEFSSFTLPDILGINMQKKLSSYIILLLNTTARYTNILAIFTVSLSLF